MKYTDECGRLRIKLVSEERGRKDGFSIVNLECLEQCITQVTAHALMCNKAQSLFEKENTSPIDVLGEVWTSGLASIIACRCRGCGSTFEIKSPRMRNDKRFEINVRGVWAQMVTGGGASKLNEQAATMGMSGMSQTTFSTIEEEIGEMWKQVYWHVFGIIKKKITMTELI